MLKKCKVFAKSTIERYIKMINSLKVRKIKLNKVIDLYKCAFYTQCLIIFNILLYETIDRRLHKA